MRLEKFQQQNEIKQNSIIASGVEEFSQKSYSDASTDKIVQNCGISKGLLFHYFGSKKNFYFYCLSQSIEKLTKQTNKTEGNFYEILFSVMNQKLQLCSQYPAETRFVNMASRESAMEVAMGKSEIFMKYVAQTQASSAIIMKQALSTLSIKVQDYDKAKEGLLLYTNALISKYLLAYQNIPNEFFKNAPEIQLEIKSYIDFMLYGIAKEANNEKNYNRNV